MEKGKKSVIRGLVGISLWLPISFFVPSASSCASGLLCSNEYGKSLGFMDNDYIEGATVERIALYPRHNDATSDVIQRMGVLVRYKDAVATIVMCHGFMCNKYDQGFLRRLFPRGRYNIMSFDFRAHGELLEGQTCTFGRDEAHDVVAAANFIRHHPELSSNPLFVYGFSMGAVAAIEAQARNAQLFDAMMLDCPFDSSENVLKRLLEKIKFSILGYEFGMPCCSILQKYAFHPYVQSFVKNLLKTVANLDPRNVITHLCPVNTVESIKKVSVPLLVIHCKNDKKISIDAIKEVYESASSAYKILWLTNGRQHFDSFFYSPEKYTERVRTFLEDYLQGHLHDTSHKEIIEDKDEAFMKEKVV